MVDETYAIYGGPTKIGEQQIMLEDYIRPQSVINIVEIPDASETNPRPDNDARKSLGGLISSQKLKEMGRVSNLFDLHELTVKVDTSEVSIGNVGLMAPNLKKLNLNNSFITSLRDLGTSLNNLNTLWLSRCCLAELDGISCIPSLKELFVAYNEIFDLSPLSMLDNIEVLDLEGNNVDDVTQVEFLSLCSKLRVLTMKGNPIEHSPTPATNKKDLKFYSYRDVILSCLPQLSMLDDVSFIEEKIDSERRLKDHPKVTQQNVFVDEFQIICDSLKAIETDVTIDLESSSEATTLRPLSARLRSQSAKSNHSGVSDTTFRSSPDKNHSSEDVLFEHRDSSALTHGKVLCGNPVQALRKRSVSKVKLRNVSKTAKSRSNPIFKPERSYLTVEEDAMEKNDVFEQLKLWRLENNSLFQDGDDSSIKSINKSDSSIVYSPSPPTKPKPSQTLTRARRSFGIELPADDDRPHSAGDFRRPALRTDVGVTSNSLEVIDEDIATSSQPLTRPIKKKEHLPARPSTARAALQTSHDIINILPAVT